MKKECDDTRRLLPRYLRGHVFALQRRRIERHLAGCPLCSSECQSLRRVDETARFLRDLEPDEGLGQAVRAGASGLGKARALMYRPLLVLAVAAAAVFLYLNIITPYRQQQEQEWRELTAPSTAKTPPAPQAAALPAPADRQAAPAAGQPAPAPKSAAASPEALPVTVAVEDEQAAIRRLNEVMRGHGVLRSKRFSAEEKEVAADLTPKELLTFIARIEGIGRITLSRSRLDAAPPAEPLPVVIRLKASPKPAVRPAEQKPQAPPQSQPAAPAALPPAPEQPRPADAPGAEPPATR